MKIFKLLSIILIINCSSVFAQTDSGVEFFWGALKSDAPRLNKVINFNDEELIVLYGKYKVNKSIYTIERQNSDFEPLQSSTFEILNDRRTYYLDIKKIGNEIILFTTKINKGTKTLLAQRFDPNTLTLSEETVALAQVNFKGKPSNYTKEFKIESSPNKNLFLLYSTPFNDELAEKSVTVSVLNSTLKPIWNSVIGKSKESVEIKYTDGLVTNKGDVFIYAQEEVKRKDKINKSDPSKVHVIYGLKKNGSVFKEYKLEQKDKKLSSPKLYMDTLIGSLLLGGFYINTEAENEKGIFLTSINTTTDQTLFSQFHPFNLDFIKQGKKDWEKKEIDKNREGDFTQYFLQHIVSTPDKGYIITGEYIRLSGYTPEGSTFIKYEYFHNDVLVFKLSANGEKTWNKKIIKRQNTLDVAKNFASYSFFQNANKLHFIYNEMQDAEEQTNIETGEISTFYVNDNIFNTVLVTFNEVGEVKKEVLFHSYEMGAKFAPHYSDQTWKNELLIYGIDENKSIFGAFSF